MHRDPLFRHFQDYETHALRGRSRITLRHYRLQLDHFDRYTRHTSGRLAILSDINDDTLADAIHCLRGERGWSPYTANKFRGCIVALWNWLATRRVVDSFP